MAKTKESIQETEEPSEVDKRLEMAFAYKKVLKDYKSDHDAVTEEIKAYAKLRLETLLGIKSELNQMFTEEEISVLKKLASAALRKLSPVINPEPRSPFLVSDTDVLLGTNPPETVPEDTKKVALNKNSGRMRKVGGQIQGVGGMPMPSGAAAVAMMSAAAAESLELNGNFLNQTAGDIIKKG
jgi:hypothetical protein